MYNLLFKLSQQYLEIFSIRRRRTEAERVFYSVSIPIFVIICCIGLIFGALHRMKKGKELYEMSDDLAPPNTILRTKYLFGE